MSLQLLQEKVSSYLAVLLKQVKRIKHFHSVKDLNQEIISKSWSGFVFCFVTKKHCHYNGSEHDTNYF